MRAKISHFSAGFLVSAIFGVALLAGFNYVWAAWTEPTTEPPGGNIAAPLNINTVFSGDVTGGYSGNNTVNLNFGFNCENGQAIVWNGSDWACGQAGGGDQILLDVLNQDPPTGSVASSGSDASSFFGITRIGDSGSDLYVGRNLNVSGGEVRAKWLHATEPGNNTIAGNLGVGITAIPGATLEVNNTFKITPRVGSAPICNSDSRGMIYYDSDANDFYGCNGNSWLSLTIADATYAE